ncbi:hypothetical protein Lalb_Chr12g0199611 [Lupinus albus]|uniref:Uncharacterized protein n=1 Tax=Lupinus albus TaxID=3870 RepID=A0A6A4PLI9_LUPAL|nr:hypothetical protein Lalb_Chr12g0199611 [Lupinus albus]
MNSVTSSTKSMPRNIVTTLHPLICHLLIHNSRILDVELEMVACLMFLLF